MVRPFGLSEFPLPVPIGLRLHTSESSNQQNAESETARLHLSPSALRRRRLGALPAAGLQQSSPSPAPRHPVSMLRPQLTSDHESSSSSFVLSPSESDSFLLTDGHTQHSNPGSAAASNNDDIVEITVDVRDDLVVVPPSVQPAVAAARIGESAFVVPSQPAAATPSDDVVEITPDVRDDSVVAVHSVQPSGGDDSSTAPRVGSSCAGPRTDRTLFGSAHRLKGLNFRKGGTDADWAVVERRFNSYEKDGHLSRARFGACVGIDTWKSEEFALQLFDALARRRGICRDWINKAELRQFWDQISDTSAEVRLQTFFDMVVKNTDGRITEEDVKEIIISSASSNKLPGIVEHSAKYAHLIMEELDPNNVGYIGLEHLERLMQQAPSEPVNQTWRESLRPTAEPNLLRRWYRSTQYFLEYNRKRVWVMLLWLSICAGLFTWKFLQYRRRYVFQVMGYCICVAKGGAEMLKFNMALILLPVCRNTITWLRNLTFVDHAVPFNDNLNFHKVVAKGITVSAGLHILPHLTCNFPRLLHATDTKYAPLAQYFSTSRNWRPPSYRWFLRGTEGWTGLTMLALMMIMFTLSSPWFRRGRLLLPGLLRRLSGFNAFWYSHHLFVVVYTLLIVHGHFLYLTQKWYKKSTWMYLAMPMVLYACERLIRVLRYTMLPVKMLKVVVYPGNVLCLHFSKPQGFQYKSGQYIIINCPAVSPYQWHPFYITSAPQDNYVSVHIRSLGDWTRELKNIFSMVCQPPMEGNSGMLRAECNLNGDVMSNPSFPKVLIDGPYGSAAEDYQKYEIVLLIGLAIGITPMISIIKDIINNMKQLEGDLEFGDANNNSVSSRPIRTRRVYFYWITREQGSSEWFRGVMDEVAETDKKGIIDFHSYFSSIYEEGDARSALIAVLQSLNYAKNGIDIVSGSRVKTHFWRPNWCNIYKRIALNHRDKRVGVFYSGAPVMEKELRDLARDFSRKTTTKFDFHKENL